MADTIYSGSVTDFRRSLRQSADMWDAMRARHDGHGKDLAATDAWLSALAAGQYAYTLAAVLAVAEREFGHEIAARLACKADDILTNGDDHDLNADVHPAGPAPMLSAAPEMTDCKPPHDPSRRCFDCATDEELAAAIPPAAGGGTDAR